MNGVHDMGGMDGFGPVVVEPDEPRFHAAWEARVLGMYRLTRGSRFHLDEIRDAIEHMPPARYLEASYYERWLDALERVLSRPASAPRPPAPAQPPPPRFRVGDRVRTRNMHPTGHTRLPRYARGKRGTVRSVAGPYLLPDTNATATSFDWQPVYAVAFSARELWGDQAPAADAVCVDVWESYLEPEMQP
jgi:nitrile hydratase subunit beta